LDVLLLHVLAVAEACFALLAVMEAHFLLQVPDVQQEIFVEQVQTLQVVLVDDYLPLLY
jgi:hypothetical protein